MKTTEILKQEAESTYQITQQLFKLVDESDLGWKPETGKNWMTLGQLVMHCTNACGSGIKGFVTGDWGLPEGAKMQDLPADQMLPPAEKMPAVEDLKTAQRLLNDDRATAMRYIDEAGEERLNNEMVKAPWGGSEMILFRHVLHMVDHLGVHKAQLFYYLKLMGKDVNTLHLWGA
ncbi:MAG: DinB family protein [Candidatus Eisenbacteria bacterium]|nr:DinB family protein [Candidatus Eisenbacteria bacterium]